MKRNFFIFLVLLAFLSGCVAGSSTQKEVSTSTDMEMAHDHGEGSHQFTKHYDNSMLQVTDHGLYSVEVIEKNPFSVGSNQLDLIVHDRSDHDVTGARIIIEPWMPMHGHGVEDVPIVMERGGGRYSAMDVHASMPGLWELRVTVSGGSGEDTVIFRFPDVGMWQDEGSPMMHGHMRQGDHATMVESHHPSERDYSTTKMSRRGTMEVYYEVEPNVIPVGKIHSWILTVRDTNGQPVMDAAISVEGWMPDHGHGMPTRPEVTMSLEEGRYLVEGMKFNMPGFWTVTFKISHGDMDDSVIFHLDLK